MPPARLKVPWEGVGDFREREDRWRRLYEAGISEDDGRLDAAERVVELLFDEQEVTVLYKGAGAIRVGDPAGLAVQLGLQADEIIAHPLAFVEDEALIAPWEITELALTTAARRNPAPILEYVANEERKAQYEAIHGRWSRGGRRSSDYFFEPEDCADLDAKYYRRGRELAVPNLLDVSDGDTVCGGPATCSAVTACQLHQPGGTYRRPHARLRWPGLRDQRRSSGSTQGARLGISAERRFFTHLPRGATLRGRP